MTAFGRLAHTPAKGDNALGCFIPAAEWNNPPLAKPLASLAANSSAYPVPKEIPPVDHAPSTAEERRIKVSPTAIPKVLSTPHPDTPKDDRYRLWRACVARMTRFLGRAFGPYQRGDLQDGKTPAEFDAIVAKQISELSDRDLAQCSAACYGEAGCETAQHLVPPSAAREAMDLRRCSMMPALRRTLISLAEEVGPGMRELSMALSFPTRSSRRATRIRVKTRSPSAITLGSKTSGPMPNL